MKNYKLAVITISIATNIDSIGKSQIDTAIINTYGSQKYSVLGIVGVYFNNNSRIKAFTYGNGNYAITIDPYNNETTCILDLLCKKL